MLGVFETRHKGGQSQMPSDRQNVPDSGGEASPSKVYFLIYLYRLFLPLLSVSTMMIMGNDKRV